MAASLTLRTDAGDEELEVSEFEARLKAGEISPQSLVRFPGVTFGHFVPACELELYQRLHRPRETYFRRAFGLKHFPYLTSGLIAFNLAVFLFTAQNGVLPLDGMVHLGAKVGPLIFDLGEVWRLLTANFLHHDALHLGLNMFVLFNVGYVLENTFRTWDYLWLLVVTGVATMCTSLAFNESITVGASGVVFGCLGGVVAFGLRYHRALPSLYRTLLSQAAIPMVIGLLMIGLSSKGVDNGAHIGGLLAGLVTGFFLRPRLLAAAQRHRFEPALRALPSLALLALVAFGQPLMFGQWLPRLRVEKSDAFGFAMPVPRGWASGADRLGPVAWYNGLPGAGRASVVAAAYEMPEGADVREAARRFSLDKLTPRALGDRVLTVQVEAPEAVRVADRDSLLVRAVVEDLDGRRNLVAYFVPRGTLVFLLVTEWTAAFPRYAQVAELMVQGVRFTEPRALRQTRAGALLFPNSPDALARLGLALLELGEAAGAAEALTAAVRGAPSQVKYRVAWSRALLENGEVDRGCAASQDALAWAADDVEALEAQARCELARGRPRRALEQLAAARGRAPDDERLRAAESKLRAQLEGALKEAP